MKARKIVFWLHLSAGILAGAVVFIMSVTGVLLAFERQIIEWTDRNLSVAPGPARLPISELVAKAGAPPSGLTLRSDPAAPVAINLGRERTIFLHPYTGAVLGEGSKATRAFFRGVTDLHRWLALSDASRETGRAITGACNLAFLFLVVSGFYLWWPKRNGRAIFLPRLGLIGKARDFNWHNAIGFWCAPFLFFIVLSGVPLSYSWATSLLYRLTRSEPPPARAAGGPPRQASVVPENIDRLCAIAAERVADWKTINVRFEGGPTAPVTFSIARSHPGRPDLRSQLALDPATGEVVRWEPFSSFNLGRRLRAWGRFVHTGEAGGLPGQTIAALASAGAAVLVWTGWTLAWRRFRTR